MCEYCEIEPVFTKDAHGHDVYDKDKSQKTQAGCIASLSLERTKITGYS